MTELALFSGSFFVVLLLGMQSLNVNNGHRILATLTSFGIGGSQIILFKLAPHASWTEIAAFILGGPVGINAAMSAHPWLVRIFRRSNP